MARTAVIFSVIFSLFLLSARLRSFLPDGGGAAVSSSAVSSSNSLDVVNPEEGNDRGTISRPLINIPLQDSSYAGLTLRRPIKLRCRHNRMGRPFALPLNFRGRHHARVAPFGDGTVGFPRKHRVHHRVEAVGFPERTRIFPGFPMKPARFGGGVERMPFGTVEPDVHCIWAREADQEGSKREEMEGGFRKRFQKHKENKRGEDNFKEWVRKSEKSLKKRFWEFLNRF